MWGRVILGTVIVTLTILWLVAIWVLLLDPRTFVQKWQGGLWNSKIDGEFTGRAQPFDYGLQGLPRSSGQQ